MSQPHESMPLQSLNDVIDRLTKVNAVRDETLVLCRKAIRLSANSIRALHRAEYDVAANALSEVQTIATTLDNLQAAHAELYFTGYVQDALKEFAEAAITRSLLLDEPIPIATDLNISDAAWLNGLAESGSELRRDVLDMLRNGNLAEATRLLERMDDVYSALVTVDFPDAITGGLRRTTDQFRAVLERTRGDLTVTSQQRRLEDAIVRLQEDLRKQEARES